MRAAGSSSGGAGGAPGKPLRHAVWGRLRWSVAAAGALVAAVAVAGRTWWRETTPPHRPRRRSRRRRSAAPGSAGLKAAYTKRFGGYKQLLLTEFPPPIPGLSFGQPGGRRLLHGRTKRADIITTWSRRFRTAAGIGPCSTIAEMKKAYGDAVQPITAAPRRTETIACVRSSAGTCSSRPRINERSPRSRSTGELAINTRSRSQQAWANFVAAVETPCL